MITTPKKLVQSVKPKTANTLEQEELPNAIVKPKTANTLKQEELPNAIVKSETLKQTDFKIDSNIPIPPRSGGKGGRSGSKYPIRNLEIGQSVFIGVKPSKVANAVQATKKVNSSYVFTSRTIIENEKEGVRVWRTA